MSGGFGDEVGREISPADTVCNSGGGSMDVDSFDTMASGSSGISSPADDVSIVMDLVGFAPCRKV